MNQSTAKTPPSKLKWNDSIDLLKSLGPQRNEFLKAEGFETVGDLLLRAPLRIIDRRQSPPFAELTEPTEGEVSAVGVIEAVGEKGFGKKKRLICIISDGTGALQGVWFKNYHYYKPELTPGRKVAFTGKVGMFDGPQITHPKVTYLDGDRGLPGEPSLVPVYPSGEEWEKIGLSRRHWPKLIWKVIEQWDGEGPYLAKEIERLTRYPSLKEAIKTVHHPKSTEEYDIALEGLKFAELYQHQLLMNILRRRRRQGEGIVATAAGEKYRKFVEGLPFKLSPGQEDVLKELEGDLSSGHPMHRLLQGEVGAGKTVVALAAASWLADAGYQTAMMAPTEILARQHYKTAIDLCEPAGIRAVLVTGGRDPEENRRALYEAAIGAADVIIGTHALFQERVQLPRLGLAIIDEQHRFGVRQRAMLVGKGGVDGKWKMENGNRRTESGEAPSSPSSSLKPHVLLMSATPIPRTLALAHYGDLELSYLPPPPGVERQVRTRVVNDSGRDKVFDWFKGELRKGVRGFLIFPVIDEGPAGLQAAEARFKPYSQIDFKGIPTALVHGRIPIDERIKSMEAFRKGEVRLLMATSVIEVGVDVPEATLMVIENGERFGLSQLHQLRGRIGRGGRKGTCVIMTSEREGQPGYERIKKLETTVDGLELAEEDLKLRGAGEPLGARQTGWVRFKLADLTMDYKLLPEAHLAALETLDRWPDLAPFPELREQLRKDYRSKPRTMLAG
jgi:ATP-dependent DNA helicase RecG